ncbi:DNA binding domain%2C excisionase family [uncultured Roseburia sp.]|uniref:Helix-turn-helix domain-containing protein n=1 Tax=Brotonthovivens ammoniilytica TaxID=2981725 RepID=A0ABT2TL51_9FIRM|nr:helix-turn-helix domain-containing protein [Brotonthovivens ammoniilytica]MCU6762269.1 helix-turn-helix domain-containing protein [Brotonthovivens ammoniilytica]SCI60788.1 DNA binding domain%2C excisionase family [uncultured Roseburia sp.]
MVENYKPIYTAKEVSKVLQVNPGTVYNLMNQGKLPYLLLGSRKIRGTDLERFIETYPIENKEELKQ